MNEAFSARSFKVDLEDWKVHINVQKSGLPNVACRYLYFPCADVASWINLRTDPKTMTLNNTIGQRLASFLAPNYHLMYHLSKPKSPMDSYFYVTTIYLSTKDIVKIWVKEPTKFCQTSTNTYKTKSLRRAYQLLIVLCCRIYGQ